MNNSFPENSFDMLLVLASKKAGGSEIDEYNSDIEAVNFSGTHLKRIRKIFMQKQKPYVKNTSIKHRLLVAVIIAILVCAVVAGGAFAYKNIVAEIKLLWDEQFISVQYDYGDSANIDFKTIEYREPSYVPDGFNRIEIARDSVGILIEYRDDRKMIHFQQDILTENYTLHTTNEDTQIDTIVINDRYDAMIAISYPANKKNITIAWNDGTYSYVLGGNVEEIILVKMAESIYK